MHWTDDQIDGYVRQWGEDPTNAWLIDAAGLRGDEAVLDVGCGSGSALRYAVSQGHRGPLMGADPYARMIFHAERLSAGLPIAFHVAGAERLPFEAACLDVVFAINSVHHWTDRAAGLAEVNRVLRPGGWFVYGGEVFGPEMLPEGQDYRSALEALGFIQVAREPLADGAAFVARLRKMGDAGHAL